MLKYTFLGLVLTLDTKIYTAFRYTCLLIYVYVCSTRSFVRSLACLCVYIYIKKVDLYNCLKSLHKHIPGQTKSESHSVLYIKSVSEKKGRTDVD